MVSCRKFGRWILAVSVVSMTGLAVAAEGGGCVYPAGVETIMPGRLPGAGDTLFLEFNNFYVANSLRVEPARAWCRISLTGCGGCREGHP